jgi:DNA-binding transcriptional ArsR family regulator
MTNKNEEKLFHERTRLAIVTELCNEPEGIQFTLLRDRLELTDGNLSRHLSALEEGKVVRIKKSFVESKPRTTVHLTTTGRQAFVDYLDDLGGLLTKAAQSASLVESESNLLRLLAKARLKKA